MINLIPPDALKQVKREYWVRVISVWLFLIGSALFILSIVHAPVYVLVRSQLSSFEVEYNQSSDTSQAFKDAETAVQSANKAAALLSASDKSVLFSTIIAEIEKHATAEISIDNFSMSRKEKTLNPIVITGEARSRLALSEFREAIENDEMFRSAALPLSNLAKDKDIPFSITIVLNKEIE